MTREREEDKRNSIILSMILSLGIAATSTAIIFDENKENEKITIASEEKENKESIKLYCNAAD